MKGDEKEKKKLYHVLPASQLGDPSWPRRGEAGAEVGPGVNLTKIEGQVQAQDRGSGVNLPKIEYWVQAQDIRSGSRPKIEDRVQGQDRGSDLSPRYRIKIKAKIEPSRPRKEYHNLSYINIRTSKALNLPKAHRRLGDRQSSREPSSDQSQLQRRSPTSGEVRCPSAWFRYDLDLRRLKCIFKMFFFLKRDL